jgi:hypothetical protein
VAGTLRGCDHEKTAALHSIRTMATLTLMCGLAATIYGQKTVTTKRGGTATATVTQKGKTATGTLTATSAKGETVDGTGSVTASKTGATEQGTVTGPKGKSKSGSATVTPK